MRSSKRGGKRLLENKHIKKDHFCRWLSLLLSLCMAISLFGGMVSFPTLAREIEQTESKNENREEIRQTELKEETQEEIKARLL